MEILWAAACLVEHSVSLVPLGNLPLALSTGFFYRNFLESLSHPF